ncbi:MAG: DUF5011 domain-containing protein [Cyclobacteriaceae bacterium]
MKQLRLYTMKLLLKNLSLIAFTVIAIGFLGCGDDDENLPEVIASFSRTVDEDTGTVTFINTSEEATKYVWNFGDGESSTEINPIKTYKTGTYTVKLTASNDAGGSGIFEDEVTILIPLVVALPANFDNENTKYEATGFNGASFEILDNPDVSGTNSSASKVGAITNIGAAFEGVSFDLGAPIELISKKSISIVFWSNKAVSVLLKLEEGSGEPIEASANHGGTGWETLTFDFNSADQYSRLTLFIDGAGTTSGTFYVDNIMQTETIDTTPPEITLLGEAIINQNEGVAFIDPGATANDNFDGDISANIVIGGDQVDINTVGTYEITYNVGDAAGNTATEVKRTVNIVAIIVDVTPPVITLIGNATINLNVGASYTDQGATAVDDIDSDVTANIVVVGVDQVDINTVGTYTITYNVSDAAGNAAVQVTRTVNVVDTTPPVITLTGNATINKTVGETYTDQGATATDDIDGNITANIVVGGDQVDINTVGAYVITYNVSDAAGNSATEVSRTVNIVAPDVDTTNPVITLVGSATISQNEGVAFVDPGATAADDTDGNITANIVVGGDAVNINAPGTYTITYNVSDVAGNVAAQVTRTVTILDITSPVITLNSAATIELTVGDTYTEEATASDATDGNITANIIVGGDMVNTAMAGTYTVTYNVTDAAGNAAIEVTRTVIVSAAQVVNLVSNGDFQDATSSPWTHNPSAFEVREDGGNKYYFANVATAGVSFNVSLRQSVVLTEGANYILSFVASTGSGTTRTILVGAGEDGDDFTSADKTITLTDVSTTYTFEFTANGVGTDQRVFFDSGADAGVVVIDDVSLVLGGNGTPVSSCPAPPTGELLSNGDFEAGDAGCWIFNAGTSISTTNNGGSNSAEIQGAPNVARGLKQQRFAVGTYLPNTSYTVTFDIIGPGALGVGGVVKVFTFSEGEDSEDGEPATQHILVDNIDTVPTSWESKSFTYTSAATAAQVEGGLSFLIEIVNSTAKINVDNVVIKETP